MTTPHSTSAASKVRGLLHRYRRFLIYGIIGGGAVVIDVALFWAFTHYTDLGTVPANALSTGIALVYSFLTNTFFNFKVRSRLWLRFLSFAIVSGFGFVVSSLMLYVLADRMGFDPILIKVLSLPVVLVVQFFLNSRITFATRTPDTAITPEPLSQRSTV
ncbi:GtrA family protein [Marisediminicola senii]|uniref:GtrA family protein n=1 Tax=Marisediminicola senii TaxID=2711233 RepID=UPI0013EC4438|nr:GtrA family protein [Marisediminicola senii]